MGVLLNVTVPVTTTILAGSSLVVTVTEVDSAPGTMNFSPTTGAYTGLLALFEDI